MAAVTGFVGRQAELAEGLSVLNAGHNLLIRGRDGIGKSAFLKELYRQYSQGKVCLWLADTSGKQALYKLLVELHEKASLQVPERFIPQRYKARVHKTGLVRWEWIKRSLSRASTQELADILVLSLQAKQAILFVESLALTPTQADLLAGFMAVTQVVAIIGDDNRRQRIQQLLFRFEREISLKPLSHKDSLKMIEQGLARQSIRFSDDRVRQDFIRAVEQDSEGIPQAIEGMLQSAMNDGEVTRRSIRAYRHESAIRYWDMTPVFLILLIVFMAMRYVSRGISEVELYVLSGVATSLFWGVTILMRRLKA